MDYLKDEKIRVLENLELDVEGNMNVDIDVIIREIMDGYDAKIKERYQLCVTKNCLSARNFWKEIVM